jgi:hypothetical protein
MSIFFLVLIVLLLAVAALVYAAIYGGRGPRYQGEAPHKGSVMRFTGTSSTVEHDSGEQRTTRV